MFIDRAHRPWLIALVLLSAGVGGIYAALPAGIGAGSWQGLLFGLSGTGAALFCALLPLRRRVQRIRRLSKWLVVRSAAWEKGHIYIGLVGVLLLHCHAGFRIGSPLTAVLMVVLWAVLLSGLCGLLFRHLLPLVKSAKDGKALVAARIIGVSHEFSLLLHVPLTVTLFGLLTLHAVMSLFY